MESIKELYRIGYGPSSSHTMAPRKAAEAFKERYPQAAQMRVTLYGSLAATGKGHLTDRAIQDTLAPLPVKIVWAPEQQLPLHPNGMQFEAIFADGSVSGPWQVYSLGGGAIGEDPSAISQEVYPLDSLRDILKRCEDTGQALWEYVEECEGKTIWEYLGEVWQVMQDTIRQGLATEGVLPGKLGLQRKALSFYMKTLNTGEHARRSGLVSAYALAAAEQNAAGARVVTAPTCGSSGILPAVLRYLKEKFNCQDSAILHALATAGLVGNFIKHNASISGRGGRLPG